MSAEHAAADAQQPVIDLLQQIDPWVTLLDAQAQGDAELRWAFFAEFANATTDFAQLAQRAQLRGLSNVCVLLARGLQDRRGRPIDDDDVGQLTLWMSGIQSYLQAELASANPLLEDLQPLKWLPKLAPAAVQTLLARLEEPQLQLAELAAIRAVEKMHAEAAEAQSQVDPSAAHADSDLFGSAGDIGSDSSTAFDASLIAIDDDAFAADFSLGEDEAAFAEITDHVQDQPSQPAQSTLDHHILVPTEFDPSLSSAEMDGSGDIWIAAEEFQLVSETVQARLQPALVDLALASDAALQDQFTEASYQIELLGNAFGVLSLEQSQSMCQRISAVLGADDAREPALIRQRTKQLQHWVADMVVYCEKPGDLPAQERVLSRVGGSDWIAPLHGDEIAALRSEFARVHVGQDPKLRAERKTVMSVEDMNLQPADDVMPNVLQGMLQELPDNAANLSESIAGFIQDGDIEHIDNARRVAHTLKGDANTVGIRGIANLTHVLEDIFIELAKNPSPPSPELAELLTEAADCVSEMADHVLGRGEAPPNSVAVAQRVLDVSNQLVEGASADDVTVGGAEVGEENAIQLAERLAEIASAAPAGVTQTPSALSNEVPMLQVPADVLDQLLNFSSEALVLLRQIENQIHAVDEGQIEIERQRQEAKTLLEELDRAVSLRGAALQSARTQGDAIDPLELDQYNELYTVSRRLIEVSADEQTARNTIERAARTLLDLTNEQEKVQLELQDRIMRTRQVPVREFVGRFQRAVRQTSKMLDKEVDFKVNGQETLIDRVQMENLIDPLMHALRNSVDHGIESQSLRMTRGKAPAGRVSLSFERDGRSVSVKIRDDGAGLNFERIRAKAIERGFMSPDDHVTNDDLAQIILLPGFSTKEEVTQVSGRGIGLDVVYQRIQDLRGSLQIGSTPAQGTTLDIRLPASLTSLYVALAQSERGWFAVATDSVESFVLVEPSQVSIEGTLMFVDIDGQKLPMSDLESLTQGYRARIAIPETTGVGVVVRGVSGDLQVGFMSAIREMRTVIVKDFGPYMRTFPGVRGGTILGDGTVAPVVDARELLRTTVYQPWSERDESYRASLAQQRKQKVLIADDSLSVRRALEQLMKDAGFEVILARDGLEALSLVKEQRPDVMLVDLEMPRMNGLDLSRFTRKEIGLVDIPIIMITSRTSDMHRQMAMDAGVNQILSKPYSEDHLLRLVQSHLAERPTNTP